MTTKTFDAVKLMRELRDKLSHEMQQMTPEQRIRYVREKAVSTDLGKKLAQDAGDAAQQDDGLSERSRAQTLCSRSPADPRASSG